MFATKLKALALVLLASCTLASLAPAQDSVGSAAAAGNVPSTHRLFAPGRTLAYANLYSTDPKVNQQELDRCARVDLGSHLIGTSHVVNLGTSVIRVRLDPDRMRANHVSFSDMEWAFEPSRMLRPGDWPGAVIGKTFQLNEKQHELLFTARDIGPAEQNNEIILRANSKGEILRLKDIGRAEQAYRLFDISSDVDGRPTATIDIKLPFDFDAAAAVEEVQKELNAFEKESLLPGMELELIPFESQSMVYAVIETPQGSKRELTSAKCHDLGAIAKDLAEVASVTSLVGYQLRTQTGLPNVATCLIHLKDRSSFSRTPRQTIATLEEKCRAMNAHVEFFEPPAFSAFVTLEGFSVRVLDKANSINDERRRKMDDLLNGEDLASLFAFLDSDYWEYELVIDNDVATQNDVSIADALEHLVRVAGGDGTAEQKFDALVEELAHSSVKNDRGEMVAYRSFMQLKNKLRPNASDR